MHAHFKKKMKKVVDCNLWYYLPLTHLSLLFSPFILPLYAISPKLRSLRPQVSSGDSLYDGIPPFSIHERGAGALSKRDSKEVKKLYPDGPMAIAGSTQGSTSFSGVSEMVNGFRARWR